MTSKWSIWFGVRAAPPSTYSGSLALAVRPRRFLALATGSRPARGHPALLGAAVLGTVLFPDAGPLVDPALRAAPLPFAVVVLPFGPGGATEGAAGVLAGGLRVRWLPLCALVNAAVPGALVPGGAPAARPVPGAGGTPAARAPC